MTRYAIQPKRNPDMPDFYDHEKSIVIVGYDRQPQPATPNPLYCPEEYTPVTLEWTRPDNGIYDTSWQAVNGWRGNRVYVLIYGGACNTYAIMVNGVHIPVQFTNADDAKRFAQHIEDDNTES